MKRRHGDVMHVSELLNGCLVVDCQLLHLTHAPTQRCPLNADLIKHGAATSPMVPLSHLFVLLSSQLLHL